MEKINRYDLEIIHNISSNRKKLIVKNKIDPVPSEDGEWVRWDDIKDKLNDLDLKSKKYLQNEIKKAYVKSLETGDFFNLLEDILFSPIKVKNVLEWEPNPYKNSMTWEQANAYAKKLGDGWRLPTIEELKEAYESIGVKNIYGFQPKFYWSSSALSQNTNYVWLIDFYNGHINDFYKLDTYYVRCVRDGKT